MKELGRIDMETAEEEQLFTKLYREYYEITSREHLLGIALANSSGANTYLSQEMQDYQKKLAEYDATVEKVTDQIVEKHVSPSDYNYWQADFPNRQIIFYD